MSCCDIPDTREVVVGDPEFQASLGERMRRRHGEKGKGMGGAGNRGEEEEYMKWRKWRRGEERRAEQGRAGKGRVADALKVSRLSVPETSSIPSLTTRLSVTIPGHGSLRLSFLICKQT